MPAARLGLGVERPDRHLARRRRQDAAIDRASATPRPGARPSGASRLSERNRPMCVAPLASTSSSSSGRSRLASRRMSTPSRVRAGPANGAGARPLPAHDRRARRAVRRCQSARVERVAVDQALPRRAVEIDRRAGRDRRRRPGDADHRRHAERARQDRGVRRPAAAFGDEAGGARPVDLRDRRRRRARRRRAPTAPSLPGTTMPRDSQRRLPTRRSTTSRTSP